MNSGLVAFGRSSACADEMQKPVSSAEAKRRRRRFPGRPEARIHSPARQWVYRI
jgi:hypothetical protein